VVCNLLCGVGHSLMRSQVHVVSESRFKAWIAGQKGASGATASAPGASG
jgi:heme/copper-type cytochrome/quinol oxidase subunit 2